MAKTNIGLATWAISWIGRPYWYGSCCYDCTTSLLNRKKVQYPSHYTAAWMPRYQQDIKAGKKCTDCIGLIKGYMWTDDVTGKQTYASNGCKDYGANGMYSAAKEKGPISTLPEIQGVILWRTGHVGVYIGNGELVEAKGFDSGVVRSKVKDRNFTNWFKLPCLEYIEGTAATEVEDAKDTMPEVKTENTVIVNANTLNVRSGPGTKYPIVTRVQRGTVFIRPDTTGWVPVVVDGVVRWVSNTYIIGE